MIRAVALAALMAAATVSAMAATPADPVVGVWAFKTLGPAGGCVMTGTLQVKAASAKGTHECTLKTREVCPGVSGDALEPCVLEERGGVVKITSKSVTISNEKFEGSVKPTYSPDHFTLRVEDATRMTGQLDSGNANTPAVFYRGPEMTS